MRRFLFAAPKQNRSSVRALLSALQSNTQILHTNPIILVCKTLKQTLQDADKGDVVFISSMSTQREATLGLSVAARRKGAFVVAGGPDPSALPKEWLKFVDAVCVGEGEEGIVAFVKSVLEGADPNEAAQIAGFATSETKPRIQHTDLSRTPPVADRFGMFGPLELTRSCPNRCAFCQTPTLFGPVRHRPTKTILLACRLMVSQGLTDLRFIAPNALGYPHWRELLESLQELRKKGARIFFGSFPSEVRPEFLTKENLRLLKRLCDNKRIVVGLQSGSEKTLERIARNHTVQQAIDGVERALNVGFEVDVDFIFGFPKDVESEEELMVSLNVAERLANIGARIHAHWFIPLPGTELEGMKPYEPSSKTEKRIRKVLGRSGFGQWQKQRSLAAKLLSFPSLTFYI